MTMTQSDRHFRHAELIVNVPAIENVRLFDIRRQRKPSFIFFTINTLIFHSLHPLVSDLCGFPIYVVIITPITYFVNRFYMLFLLLVAPPSACPRSSARQFIWTAFNHFLGTSSGKTCALVLLFDLFQLQIGYACNALYYHCANNF